ncbi:helix-turn-helix domain-containing protein [Thermogemmatispora onikobensis]|jgi:excisionase family DNA binding protein|uniref:helix-turn-helix domain-containing protein n=1 Tax=Thermogemmatispora onikobensis TaxID=732234 RepID=UPI000A009F21|nr:helix-turn-helix domain-containing protein [Thermogemmatispora onikobensis]
MCEGLMTAKEAADYMRVSVRTIRDWVKKGLIPVVPVGAQEYRFTKKDLDHYIETQRQIWQPRSRRSRGPKEKGNDSTREKQDA